MLLFTCLINVYGNTIIGEIMQDKDLGFRNYKEVKDDKKGLSEIPACFISIAFVIATIITFIICLNFKKTEEANKLYGFMHGLAITGIVMVIILIGLEIIYPIRLYFRFAKQRGDKNGFVISMFVIQFAALFVMASFLLIEMLLVF